MQEDFWGAQSVNYFSSYVPLLFSFNLWSLYCFIFGLLLRLRVSSPDLAQ